MTLPISSSQVKIRNILISPALMLAPMAGLTHSAFRRLISEFGGYGALYTEMLCGTALVSENLNESTFTRRRTQEGPVFYQLKLNGSEPLERIFDRLRWVEPTGIDINLGCPAPLVKSVKAGGALFDDAPRLRRVLDTCRKLWDGVLTVKCRLGKPSDEWQETLARRLKLFEECGVDAITVHPRFLNEKLKRKARWNLFPFIASHTKLPLIANGDISDSVDTEKLMGELDCPAVMIGRMAAVKPWIFSEICGGPVTADYHEVWQKACSYILEDFTPNRAIGRIKQLGAYYSRNFFFGHQLYAAVQSSPDIPTLLKRADEFLLNDPRVTKEPSVMGI
ncbi:MAG: tRNA-dihydrouridine synthase family protein [Fibrobacterota bacterium]